MAARRAPVAVAAAGAWLAIAAIALHLLGVGGYRYGFLLVLALLTVPAVALVAVGARDGTALPVWVITALVVAVTLTAVLVDAAPPSRSVLVDQVEELDLPFFDALDREVGGSSLCRPACPVVVQTWRTGGSAPIGALTTVLSALHDDGLAPAPESLIPRDVRRSQLEVSYALEDQEVHVSARRVEAEGGGSDILVTLRFEATR